MSFGLIVVVLVAEVLLWGAAAWHDRGEPLRVHPTTAQVPQSSGQASSPDSLLAQETMESKVIFIGNSHTRGAGLPINKSFPAQLDARWRAQRKAQPRAQPRDGATSWRALNLGRTNYNSTQIREALPSWLDESGAKLVVAMVGEPNLWNRVGKEAAMQTTTQDSHYGTGQVGSRGILGALQSRSRLLNFLSLLWLRHRDVEARAWRALGIVEPNYRGPGNFAPQEWEKLYRDDLRRAQELEPKLSGIQLCRWKAKLKFLQLELEADLRGTHAQTLAQLQGELDQAIEGKSTQQPTAHVHGFTCGPPAALSSQADAVAWLLTAERLWARAKRSASQTTREAERGDLQDPTRESSAANSRSKAWQALRESVEADANWKDVYPWMLKLGSLEGLTRQQRLSVYQKALSVDPTHSLAAQLVLQELIDDENWTDFLKVMREFQQANPLSAQFAPGHFRNLLSQKAPQGVIDEFDRAEAQLVAWRPEASALYVDFSEAEWRAWLERDLQGILEIVESKGAQLVLQGYPPYRSPIGGRVCRILDPWLKEFAKNRQLPWIDTCLELETAFTTKQKVVGSRESYFLTQYGPHDDHLNERGYALLAEILERELRPILENVEAGRNQERE